jgi:hypothetical protein
MSDAVFLTVMHIPSGECFIVKPTSARPFTLSLRIGDDRLGNTDSGRALNLQGPRR